MINKVFAPFNFVPTPNSILCQELDSSYNELQDVPFKDGFSGKIHLKVTAETPIYVRNGHSKEEEKSFKDELNKKKAYELKDIRSREDFVKKHEEYCDFCRTPDGKFVIPGTTLKGAVREVLCILSRGKLHVDPMAKPAIQRKFPKKHEERIGLYDLIGDLKKIKAGWIRFNGNRYEIIPALKYFRISLEQVDELFGTTVLKSKFQDPGQKLQDTQKTAKYKYNLLKNIGLQEDYVEIEFSERKAKRISDISFAKESSKSKHRGIIVLTGQSTLASDWGHRHDKKGQEKRSTGKYYDFVFSGRNEDNILTLSDEDFQQYDSVYGDSEDWKRLNKFVDDGKEYPIFFREDEDSEEGKPKVKDFGLTLLYKLPYNNDPIKLEMNRSEHYVGKADMAERIFGFAEKSLGKGNNISIRGRVQFQHLFCTKDNGYFEPKAMVLNSPKITYYPIYIRQDYTPIGQVIGNYKTFNDGILSGWKRYVRRPDIISTQSSNPKLETLIHPLNAGTVFEGDIVFHNLKEVELGALLSALTFHGNEKCRHQIGQGKPYGYGAIHIEAQLTELLPNLQGNHTDINSAMAAFEHEMRLEDPNWFKSETIRELFALASSTTAEAKPDVKFNYMKLGIKKGDPNEFVLAKGDKSSLPLFSELLKEASIESNSFLSKSQIDSILKERDEIKQRKE